MGAKHISLAFREGSSDKVYHVHLTAAPDGTGWLLSAQSGPRNGNLTPQNKITTPVAYEVAFKEFNKLVKAKMAKGYQQIDGDGFNLPPALVERKDAGVRPQLLNEIEDRDFESFLRDSSWYMQEKADGERVMIAYEPGKPPIGINRKGVQRSIPTHISGAIQTLGVACVIDGELVGGYYHAFDLIEYDGDLRDKPFRHRSLTLDAVLSALPSSAATHFPRMKTYVFEADKRQALSQLRAAKAEGVVFHLASSPYTAGRPSTGGDAMKFKFWASASCIVAGKNDGKRSVSLKLIAANGDFISVGNVAIPANAPVPDAGEILEVRYLYAYPNGGSLFEPSYRGVRTDIDTSECLYSQLKFKAEALAA